ncbi:MAG: signal peptidase II [Nocardioides sp.]
MQVTRGTSLNHTRKRPVTSASHPGRTRSLAWFAGCATGGYFVDVVSKLVAVRYLTDRPDVEVIGNWFRLHLVRNPGAAFSAGTEFTFALACLASVAVCVIGYLVATRLADPLWGIGLGLLFGGVAGNLTDRIMRAPGPMRGHVVDFFQLPHWPVFNVADMCINAAAAVILVQTYRQIRIDGTLDIPGDTSGEASGDTSGDLSDGQGRER